MSKVDFWTMDIRNLDEEFDRVFGTNALEMSEYYQKKVRIPCKNTICRFNIETGCNKTIAYHPVFIEGQCQSMQYDS